MTKNNQNMIEIEESGMKFGPFECSHVFQIEKSELYKNLHNIKTVEFILENNNKLQFIEAKSSSPKPVPDNLVRFEEFIDEISQKFLHSLNLYYTGVLGRHGSANDLPDPMKKINHQQVSIKFILVIKNHQDEWLLPIKDALERKMSSISSIWESQVAVINAKTAQKYKLIQSE